MEEAHFSEHGPEGTYLLNMQLGAHQSSLESVGLRADQDSWEHCGVTNWNGQSGKSTFPGVSCESNVLPPGGVQVGKAVLAEGLG